MPDYSSLFDNNRKWSEETTREDPTFFSSLAAQQSPEFLWIGCSDSRVSANEIVGLRPGEVFVHRNVANQVIHTDFNCLSVVEYAVEVLRVKHIILTGHYGCGGVKAALKKIELGLIDNWLYSIRLIAEKHKNLLDRYENLHDQVDRLCELNVIEQVRNLCTTSLLKNAWSRGQEFQVHACVYGLSDGILHDLQATVSGPNEVEAACQGALDQLIDGHRCPGNPKT